jgi:hypothetical protein
VHQSGLKLTLAVYAALSGTEHQDEDVWEIMKPSDFSTFVIPFEMEGDTQVRTLCSLMCSKDGIVITP